MAAIEENSAGSPQFSAMSRCACNELSPIFVRADDDRPPVDGQGKNCRIGSATWECFPSGEHCVAPHFEKRAETEGGQALVDDDRRPPVTLHRRVSLLASTDAVPLRM